MAEIPSKKLPFSEGLKVLVIDHDPTVLQNIEEMCIKCHYKVITCSTFQAALNHIRESDVILVELEMPNMDGYGFIQNIGKEVDVPIIAMSNNDSEDLRLKALVHGAWNYVKKPLHEEHIIRLWQPVKRKASKESTLEEKFGNLENKHGNHDSAAAVQESQEGIMEDKKRNISPKDSGRDEPDDSYAPQVKKRRVVWDKELHNKFLEAVKKLEPENAVVPKKILEQMNDPNLTRENVASHLQKYRHQCKGKPDGTTREKQKGMPLSRNVSVTGEFIFQPLGGIRQVSYQTVAANPPHQWPNHSHAAEQGVSRNHPITRCPSNMSLADQSRHEAAWLPSNAAMRVNNSVGMQQGNHMSISMINALQQQQQQQQLLMRQQQLLMLHGIHMNPASVNQNCNFDGNSLPVVQIPGQSNNVRGIFHGYSAADADADAAAASIPQQGFSNVAAPVLRSFPAAVSVTQFPESFNLAYDPNEIYMPTKPVEPETESNEEDEDDTRS